MIRATLLIPIAMLEPSLLIAQQNTLSSANQTTVQNVSREIIYKCESEGAQLQGNLIERMFYGPPGFGETPAKDAREKPLILQLEKPIILQPAENANPKTDTCLETFRHVQEVQLFFLHSPDKDARKLLGKRVAVVGKLDEDPAPSIHTDVMMEVESISPR